MEKPPHRTWPQLGRFWLRRGLIHLASTVVLLAALEGLAALLLRNQPVLAEKPPVQRNVAERQHTRYDELLGWVNVPNVVLTNMYGEGRHVNINNLGFRGTETIDPAQPAAEGRIILSGDSFTFGYGVGDDHTWGAELARLEPDMEILNMGLGGYGLDQAFLWYQREGDPLPHDLHIFSFITENFRRMTRDRFMGYGKPVVTVHEGQLVVENVPPPWPEKTKKPLSRLQLAAQNSNLLRLLHLRLGKYRMQQSARWVANAEATASRIFAEVFDLHNKAGRTGVLVYLPVESDYHDGDSDGWRRWLGEQAKENNWAYIDLVEEMRHLPKDQIDGLFIGQDSPYSGARGHYTEAGNAWVAATLHQHLIQHPVLARELNALTHR